MLGARGTDQRNHPGTGRDVCCVRSKRSVGTYPAERLLLSPSDLPERQPAILCSSQRDHHGWRQRVPILSERNGEIAAKSCSYAHNRHMSHPRIFKRVGSPDTEDTIVFVIRRQETTATRRTQSKWHLEKDVIVRDLLF